MYFIETKNPVSWNKKEVSEWIAKVCEDYEIDEAEVSLLKILNGRGLDVLTEQHWRTRSPQYGDIFLTLWQEVKKDYLTKTKEDYIPGKCSY